MGYFYANGDSEFAGKHHTTSSTIKLCHFQKWNCDSFWNWVKYVDWISLNQKLSLKFLSKKGLNSKLSPKFLFKKALNLKLSPKFLFKNFFYKILKELTKNDHKSLNHIQIHNLGHFLGKNIPWLNLVLVLLLKWSIVGGNANMKLIWVFKQKADG